jgi:hypothetical protein
MVWWSSGGVGGSRWNSGENSAPSINGRGISGTLVKESIILGPTAAVDRFQTLTLSP